MGIHVLLRIWAFATTETQRHRSVAPNPAPTPSLGAKTHCTLTQGDQPPSAFASLLKHRFFIPSVHDSPKRPLCDGSDLWQPVHQHVYRQAAAGLRAKPSWVGGHHHSRGSLLWRAGTSASTLHFVYQFLANEPFSSQKKVIQSDSKDESCSKPGREQWGNVWTRGLQPC